jgi:hypothetical protein
MARMARRLAALERRLDTMERDGTVDETFYRALEDRFRGSEDDIRDRQRSYAQGIARIRDEWPVERR